MKLHFFELSLVALALVFNACSHGDAPGKGPNMPKTFDVEVLTASDAVFYKEYPANLEGIQTVEIRPRVSGYIESILVDEGATVKKGQLLFQLNASDLEAQVRSAAAMVKVAETQVAVAKIDFEKIRPLVEKQIVSQFELESSKAALAAKEAQLAQAKANWENAKANLSYTRITSPTDGAIGNFPYRVGSLVSSASPEPLTVIANTSAIYAYFSMDEKAFLSLTKSLEGRNLQEKLAHLKDVSLLLADNSLYELPGQIETASSLIDQATGAVSIRVRFENPGRMLRSGSSGKVRIAEHIRNALVIPQKATYELQEKHFVYLLGADTTAVNTEIEVVAGNLKDTYVVTSGLKLGDKVIVEGIASLKNGTVVIPRIVDADAAATAEAPKENQTK
jgi:membrane fusion protein (multidrug efflux system)